MRLQDFNKETRELVVALPEGALRLTYRAKTYTARYEQAVLELEQCDQPASQLVSLLAQILVDWDVTDAEGASVAPSVEVLSELPIETVSFILKAIREDSLPNLASGELSAAG
ncbi:MAG: hypothetical protein JSS72_01900 [Armatimonadetes bacterium]|nr:hypothetical protein [Armatimonadota bacterium]